VLSTFTLRLIPKTRNLKWFQNTSHLLNS